MSTEWVGKKGLKKIGDLPEDSQLMHSGSNSGVEVPAYVVVKNVPSGIRLERVTSCVFCSLPGLGFLVSKVPESPALRLQADTIPPGTWRAHSGLLACAFETWSVGLGLWVSFLFGNSMYGFRLCSEPGTGLCAES